MSWLIQLGRFEVSLGRLLARTFWRLIYGLTVLIEALGRAVAGAMGGLIWLALQLAVLPIKLILLLASTLSGNLKASSRNFNHRLSFWQHNLHVRTARTQKAIDQRSDTIKSRIDKRIKRLSQVQFNPHARFLKPAAAFSIVLFLVLAPFAGYRNFNYLLGLKDKIVLAAEAAMGNMQSAKQAAEGRNLNQAAADFSQAGEDFLQAETDIARVNGLLLKLASIAPNNDLKLAGSAQKLAAAGRIGSAMAANLSEAVNAILQPGELTDRLQRFNTPATLASNQARELQQILADIQPEDLPQQYSQDFRDLKAKAELVNQSLAEIVDLVENIKIFAGAERDQRYMLVFQNNSEVRASGGFIGSFAIIDLAKGKIKKMVTPGGGAYDTEAGLRTRIAAPDPLWLVNPLWHLWDANWWPDWPMTAKKLAWFYEQSDGSVDGVIAFTPDTIVSLLKLLGPIELPGYNVTITDKNFVDTVQFIAEQKTGATSTPKSIIGDLSSVIIDRLGQNLDRPKLVAMLSLLEKSLEQKQILLYFSDSRLEQKVASLGWDGAIKQADNDYLMVVNSNIAGGKSDRRIKQGIEHQATVATDGSIIDTVIITRFHNGVRGELFSGVRNNDWMRIYVPLGAQLLSADGFQAPEAKYFHARATATIDDPDLLNERLADTDPASNTKIYRELDKTVFANWLSIDPREKKTITLVYKLPFKLRSSAAEPGSLPSDQLYKYTLLLQKQPGAGNVSYHSSIQLDDGKRVIWHYPEQADGPILLDTDKINAYLISR